MRSYPGELLPLSILVRVREQASRLEGRRTFEGVCREEEHDDHGPWTGPGTGRRSQAKQQQPQPPHSVHCLQSTRRKGAGHGPGRLQGQRTGKGSLQRPRAPSSSRGPPPGAQRVRKPRPHSCEAAGRDGAVLAPGFIIPGPQVPGAPAAPAHLHPLPPPLQAAGIVPLARLRACGPPPTPGRSCRRSCFPPRLRGTQVPVACKSCPCGYIFISRKLLNAKHPEKSPPSTENKHEAKRRRTERVRREKINSTVNKDLENRKRSRSNSHSDHIRRGRGRPKTASAKKHEEEREKQEKEIDIYANLSDEKAFVFSVALAEINRKIINQRLIL
nr:UPF0547 protein C16orf87 homolog [Vulpes vulpes]